MVSGIGLSQKNFALPSQRRLDFQTFFFFFWWNSALDFQIFLDKNPCFHMDFQEKSAQHPKSRLSVSSVWISRKNSKNTGGIPTFWVRCTNLLYWWRAKCIWNSPFHILPWTDETSKGWWTIEFVDSNLSLLCFKL